MAMLCETELALPLSALLPASEIKGHVDDGDDNDPAMTIIADLSKCSPYTLG